MSASELSICNGALTTHIGERAVTQDELTNGSTETARTFSDVWSRDGIETVLNSGQWNFAIRSAKIDSDPSVSPSWGYQYAFDKPTDFVRVCGVCQDEYFRIPLLDYNYEAGYWFTNIDPIYVRYVSNDSAYGGDYSLWPPHFQRYVEAWVALQMSPRLTHSPTDKKVTQDDVDKLLKHAQAEDAMQQPTRFPPPSSWVLSRRGRNRRGPFGDGGLSGNLTG